MASHTVNVSSSVGDHSGADYTLDVRVGRSRYRTSCGSVRNVVYILSNASGRLMIIKGRGLTGSCSPNVFDDLSQKLAFYAVH